jgi:membrane protein implicated in regulation of membrane protease activity
MPGPWFWWALLGLLLVGAETFLPGLTIIFFGFGALATALLSLLPFIAARPGLQALLWTAASVASLFLLRRRFKELLRGTAFYRPDDDRPIDGVAGEEATVIEAIGPDAPGRVHFRGTSWKALAYEESFEPGATVRVAGRDGLSLVVTADYLAALDAPGALPPPGKAPDS